MVSEVVQPFWAALQRGEFIIDVAGEVGTYRKAGTRWVAEAGGVRRRLCGPRRSGARSCAVPGSPPRRFGRPASALAPWRQLGK